MTRSKADGEEQLSNLAKADARNANPMIIRALYVNVICFCQSFLLAAS
jgi:hypothetical protein